MIQSIPYPYPRLAMSRDIASISLPIIALGWAIFSWWRTQHRAISVRQVGTSITDRVIRYEHGIYFVLEIVVTNNSPTATITVAYYELVVPWKDSELELLIFPNDEVPENYDVPGYMKLPKDWVLNHRRFQRGKLAPGDAFRGALIFKGRNPVPRDLSAQEYVRARIKLEDTTGKNYSSEDIEFW